MTIASRFPALFSRLVALIVFIGIASAGTVRAQNALSIAATVNDDVISLYDLQARIWLTIASTRLNDSVETRKRLAHPMLRDLIDEKLKMQEAARQKVTVTESDLHKALADLETRNKLPVGGLDAYLAQLRIDRASLVSQMEAEIAWVKVVRRMLGPRITVSDEEIKERLAQMEAKKGRPERHLGEIYLPVDSPQNEAEVGQLAARLFDELRAKHNFSEVARNFSRSPSAAVGGDLGWVPVGQLHPDIEAAIANLKVGSLSPPLRLLDGYYIFVFTEERVSGGAAQKDATVLGLQQIFLPLSATADEAAVRSQISLAEQMASSAKSCADMEKLGAEAATGLSGSLGKVALNKLPDALRDAVADLPVGKPSTPIRTKDGVIVLMVCSREGDDQTKSARDAIRDELYNQRLMAAADEYLRDLRRKAFVDVRL